MKPFNFPPELDWNQMLQILGALMTRAKKSHGMKILKNRSVDGVAVGVGIVMAGWWIVQFTGLPQPLKEFVDASDSNLETRAAIARIELTTRNTNDRLQDLSLDIERYKENHARTHHQLNRTLKNGYSD